VSATFVMGIDPGIRGAIALFDPLAKKVRGIWDFPTREKHAKTEIDLPELALLVDEFAKDTAFALVEDVGAMTYVDKSGKLRGQGAAASFNFGKAAGQIQGILAACFIPIFFIKPAVWKSLMGLSSNKNESREKAMKLFPEHTHTFARAKDDGRAEALLLAVFGGERFKIPRAKE
jgi:crossover junction endodeoxyribonuclease RuvC